jgi:formylglycine-generating enzyme required for sulfatase activity
MKRYALLTIAMLVCTVSSLPQAGRIRPETSLPANQQLTPRSGPLVIYLRGVKTELVPIPPDSFQMGADQYSNERPKHEVRISKEFFLGRYEVTQAQWRAVMNSNPSRFRGDSLPVEQVSWNDAQNFIQALNRMNDGYTYRLPTEAEWEYAWIR